MAATLHDGSASRTDYGMIDRPQEGDKDVFCATRCIAVHTGFPSDPGVWVSKSSKVRGSAIFCPGVAG
jgi:hypothetical protein